MGIGQQITQPLPTSGDTSWDSELNELLQALIDAVEAKVTVDGLNVSGTLDVHGATVSNLGLLKFILVSDPGTAKTIYMGSDGEYYLRDGANNQIKLTSTGSLNVGSISGFSGDFQGSSAAANYSSANGRFTFTSSPGTVAEIEAGKYRLRQGTDANFIGLTCPANLASDLTITMPTSYPSTRALVVMDATGSLMYETARLLMTCSLDVASAQSFAATNSYNTVTGWTLSTAGAAIDRALDYNDGDRIEQVDISTAGVSVTASIIHRHAGQFTQHARVCFNGGGEGYRTINSATTTLTGTMPFTPPSSGTLFIRVECGGGGAEKVHGYRVIKTRSRF